MNAKSAITHPPDQPRADSVYKKELCSLLLGYSVFLGKYSSSSSRSGGG